MNNLVVQLLLKTGTFSSDLKQARGQIQNFQQGCQTAGKSVSAFGSALGLNVGALTKLGGAVGIAVAAGKEFKAIIESNQRTSDAFQGAIAGCKGVIDSFNQAIAMADFSAFRDGLWSVYDAAKAARDAIDDLQDASWAYSYFSNKNTREFNDARNIFNDPDSTKEMKDAAISQMEEVVNAQWDAANAMGKKQLDAYKAQIVKEAGAANIKAKDITMSQFEQAARIKLYGDTQQEEAQINRRYKEYQRQLKEYGKNNITAQEELKKEYADVIAVRAILISMNDKELETVVKIANDMETATAQAQSMERTLDRAKKSMNDNKGGSGSGSKQLKDEIVVQEQSLEWWNKLAQEARKHRDAEVYNSDAWNAYNTVLMEANQKIKDINTQTELLIKRQEEMAKGLLPAVEANPKLQGKAEVMTTTGLNGETIETKRSVTELQNMIRVLEELRNELKEGDPYIANYNQQIAELRKRIEEIQSAGIQAPAVPKETINTWDTFNSALSNTSTIVSSLTNTFKDGTEMTASSILSMVSTVLPAIGTLITSIQALTVTEAVEAGVGAVGKAVSTSKHWIEAIAAVASLTAVVAAAIAAASQPSTKKYATGGIVGGNSFTGDRVVANVNSGEMILNKAQQANLFRLANGGFNSNREVEFHISGTELVGVLNNVNRKNRVIR